jgi:hypothetical protein
VKYFYCLASTVACLAALVYLTISTNDSLSEQPMSIVKAERVFWDQYGETGVDPALLWDLVYGLPAE